jgi:hypothetical protein
MRLAGRLAALERHLADLILPDPVVPHPLPDLTGASVEGIVVALFNALEAAHAGDEPDGKTDACAACMATVVVADRYASAGFTTPPWPPPLLHAFDAAPRARGLAVTPRRSV